MLSKYHDLIFNLMDDNFFYKLKNFKYINKDLLRNGLHYPDIPCSKLISTTNDDIKFYNYKTCHIPYNLIYLFNANKNSLKQIVYSHRGKESIGHSMTFDPNATLQVIKLSILKRIEILYMLALNDFSIIEKCNNNDCNVCYIDNGYFWNDKYSCDNQEPNIFWLGQIIHCIQDSYSRVHTLRTFPNNNDINNKDDINNDDDKNSLINSYEQDINTFNLIENIDYIINNNNIHLHENEYKDFLQSKIKEPYFIKLIKDNPNDIKHMFKYLLFNKNQNNNIMNIYKTIDNVPSFKYIDNNNNDPNFPTILSFRYIQHQKKCGTFFHMNYDTYESNNIFIPFMEENIKFIFNLYEKHILDESKSIADKIDELIKYLSIYCFSIKNKNYKSAVLCEQPLCECELSFDKVYNNYIYKNKYLKYKTKYLKYKNIT